MGTSWQLQEDTRAVNSTQQILTLFADVSQRRTDYIEIVSLSHGVPQPTSWGEYTRECADIAPQRTPNLSTRASQNITLKAMFEDVMDDHEVEESEGN